jgi:glycosyltransferase involved in cell wall biosynthesis
MPRLLQINSTIGQGSTGRIAKIISEQASSDGWDCYSVHGSRYVGELAANSIQVSGKLDEYAHFLLSRVFDMHGLGSCNATKQLISAIDSIHPDVVHIHNIHGYYVNYELLFRHLVKAQYPTVITMHDFWLMTGHCAYINKSCPKWETGCGTCSRLHDYPSAFLDRSHKNWELKRELFQGFNKDRLVLVPVSYWLEGYAKRSLLRECRFHVIQNGVDTRLFKPHEGEHSELWKTIDWEKHTIMTVADRWTDANGFKDIMQLSKVLPDDTQMLMVGLNNDQLNGLPSNVVGIGHTDNVQQLVELYSSSDVLFNASKEVTFGLVTAESMACGTPAIVFKDTAGEEIIDNSTGFTINCLTDIPSLVHLCSEKADEYRDKCRNRVLRNFDAVSQYSKYLALYYELRQASW